MRRYKGLARQGSLGLLPRGSLTCPRADLHCPRANLLFAQDKLTCPRGKLAWPQGNLPYPQRGDPLPRTSAADRMGGSRGLLLAGDLYRGLWRSFTPGTDFQDGIFGSNSTGGIGRWKNYYSNIPSIQSCIEKSSDQC